MVHLHPIQRISVACLRSGFFFPVVHSTCSPHFLKARTCSMALIQLPPNMLLPVYQKFTFIFKDMILQWKIFVPGPCGLQWKSKQPLDPSYSWPIEIKADGPLTWWSSKIWILLNIWKWYSHVTWNGIRNPGTQIISNMCTKANMANRSLQFHRWNIYQCPQDVKEAAYKDLLAQFRNMAVVFGFPKVWFFKKSKKFSLGLLG